MPKRGSGPQFVEKYATLCEKLLSMSLYDGNSHGKRS
jgi:hypothetical protein